jgi:acetyl-CoA carboxylase biotin carboxyl carrier protein
MPQRVPTMKKPTPKQPSAQAVKSKTSKPARAKSSNDFTELRNLQEIKDLIEFVAEKNFDQIEIERGDFRLRISKGGERIPVSTQAMVQPMTVQPSITPAPVVAPASVVNVELSAPPAQVEEDLHIITSPIVGTFYRSSSPTVDPFIKIGDSVNAGQTLCIVEAMKLMNEIQSDVSGSIVKIFVENAQPIEYGQPLFGLKL